jgi:hypothetical protein
MLNPVSCLNGNDGCALAAPFGGNGVPYNYAWSPSGGNGATACNFTAGVYTVTVTDYKGCTGTDTTQIAQPSVALFATPSNQQNVSCNGACDGSVVVTVSGGVAPYSYNFTPIVGSTYTVTGLCGGSPSINITDSYGCAFNPAVSISEPNVLTAAGSSITDVTCGGGSNGSATVSVGGGTPGYSFLWTPSGQTTLTATSLAAGTYTVTVTDAHGCTITSTATITQPAVLTNNAQIINNVLCNGGNNGSAHVTPGGGTGPYTYLWTCNGQTTQTATNLAVGTCTVSVTDSHGCVAISSVSITEPAVLTASALVTSEVSCNGYNDGCASVTAVGGTIPYTYEWSTGSSCSLIAGSYTVTVTDVNGCSATSSVTITQPTALTTTSSHTNASCFSCPDGTATANPSGGTGPYTYSWSTAPIQTSPTATGLLPGTYACCITDAHDCSTCTNSETVTSPVSVGNISVNSNFLKVYPNPFHSSAILIISSEFKIQKAELIIYDMLGNEVQKTEIQNQEAEVKNLSAGIYLLKVIDANSGRVAQIKLTVE